MALIAKTVLAEDRPYAPQCRDVIVSESRQPLNVENRVLAMRPPKLLNFHRAMEVSRTYQILQARRGVFKRDPSSRKQEAVLAPRVLSFRIAFMNMDAVTRFALRQVSSAMP